MKQEIIDYLKNLNIEELGDILMEVGAFRNPICAKQDVENDMNVELDYPEYNGIDYVDIFVFPRQKEFLDLD